MQVFSSVIAAWADVRDTGAYATGGKSDVVMDYSGVTVDVVTGVIKQLNVGYFWMLLNCLASAAYVSSLCSASVALVKYLQVLAMRKRIKVTGFSDWDSM